MEKDQLVLNYSELESQLKARFSDYCYGESIKPHTAIKIDFVSSYVDKWLYVICNMSDDIYFIDVMCNAGLYRNGYLSTCVRVLEVFTRHAKRNPTKRFHLIANDYDFKKKQTMDALFAIFRQKMREEGIFNVFAEITCMDAANCLSRIQQQYGWRFSTQKKKSILLFVDPYNFLTTELALAVESFMKIIYCELLVNFFFNDYVRNVCNLHSRNHRLDLQRFTTDYCGSSEPTIDLETLRDLFIRRIISNTRADYHYYFTMKNETRGPLYYLMFFTPSLTGLEKVKNACYEVIGWRDEYCVAPEKESLPSINLFGETPEENALSGAREKINRILLDEKRSRLSFDELEQLCLENTFMKPGHVIKYVIKPLIDKGVLRKAGKVSQNNFKKDDYFIGRY